MHKTNISPLLVVGIALVAFAIGTRSIAAPNPILIDHTPAELRDIAPRLWVAVYSPDGRTLATTAGWTNPQEPGELVLWDIAKREPKLILRQKSTIRTAAFSSDGKKLAIGDFEGITTILDPQTGQTTGFPQTRQAGQLGGIYRRRQDTRHRELGRDDQA